MRSFVEVSHIEMYCDNMTSVNFETLFASWPFRYYIVSNTNMKILKIGQPKNAEFDIADLD